MNEPLKRDELRESWLQSSSRHQSINVAGSSFKTSMVREAINQRYWLTLSESDQKRSGDPNPQYFSKSIAVQMGGVLPYKWEAYCSTNGRRIAGFPFLRSLEARKARRYKWGAYCRTNWRCTAVLSRQVVGVGVSKTLPK